MELYGNRSVAGGVLEPIGLEHFFKDYWEQKPLHIERSESNPFSDLISIENIEVLLSTNTLSSQLVQLSHAGKRIAINDYADDAGQIVSSRIVEGYKNGNTIIMSQAQQLVPELMELCRDVQASLMMRCQTNLYLSPAGNQGFNPHYDTHDVFILQVSGSKQFNFYTERSNHPTNADRFDKDRHAVGEKTETVKLSAGDTLYIPRGVVHDAVADTAAPSLHITLGVYPILLHTLLEDVVQKAIASDARLRRSISQPLWMLGQGVERTTQLLREVIQMQVHDDVVAGALQQLRNDVALDGVKDVKGVLTQAHSVITDGHKHPERTLIETTKLNVNHRAILHVERSEESVVVRTFGQVLEFPQALGQALDWLLGQTCFVMADIPGLDVQQQESLVLTLRSVDILVPD